MTTRNFLFAVYDNYLLVSLIRIVLACLASGEKYYLVMQMTKIVFFTGGEAG
jgi:hypothetical protein